MRTRTLILLAALMLFSAILWYTPGPSRLLRYSGLQFIDKRQRLRVIASRLRALKRLRNGVQ